MTNARDLPDVVYAAGGHFPHHNETVARGHSNASVNRTELLTALVLVESADIEMSPHARYRAKTHLAAHARGLSINLVTEADDESTFDRESRVMNDFHDQFGSMFSFDSPWVVDIWDTFVIARESNGRYQRYDLAEENNSFTFSNPVEVRKAWNPVGDGATTEGATHTETSVIKQLDSASGPEGVSESIKILQENSADLTPAQIRLIHAHSHELHERYQGSLLSFHEAVETLMTERDIDHETWDDTLDEKAKVKKGKKPYEAEDPDGDGEVVEDGDGSNSS